jgi:hypothetical protein
MLASAGEAAWTFADEGAKERRHALPVEQRSLSDRDSLELIGGGVDAQNSQAGDARRVTRRSCAWRLSLRSPATRWTGSAAIRTACAMRVREDADSRRKTAEEVSAVLVELLVAATDLNVS